MVIKTLIKKTIYPRPHNRLLQFQLSSVVADNYATIIPLIANDEGLGDPDLYKAHPEHASFTEVDDANCYPDSYINRLNVHIYLSLSKLCWNTDKIEELRCFVMPIYMSFLEDYTANDEKSTLDVSEILKLQKESTDRQGYPLFNGTKLIGDILETGSLQAGLTTNTLLEGVDFSMGIFRDALQYYTNMGKLKNSVGYGKWYTVKRRGTKHISMNIKLNSKVKRMNPYTFCGVLIYTPQTGSGYTLHISADDSAIQHLNVNVITRFLEWNENFDMTKT